MDLVRVNSHDEETWQLIGDFPHLPWFFSGDGSKSTNMGYKHQKDRK
jgi:hypothetical protein